MNGLINLLCSLNINNADVLEYTKRLKNIQIKKGEHFQMQGCPVRYMGYVDSGKFRYYKIDKEGNERTLWFNKFFPQFAFGIITAFSSEIILSSKIFRLTLRHQIV